jgi:hypothetical protein
MANAKRLAEVQYTKEGPQPLVEMSVPHGTLLQDVLKAQEVLSRELFPEISPRGCLPCISGLHFVIRERFEEVIQIDLDAGEIIGR